MMEWWLVGWLHSSIYIYMYVYSLFLIRSFVLGSGVVRVCVGAVYFETFQTNRLMYVCMYVCMSACLYIQCVCVVV